MGSGGSSKKYKADEETAEGSGAEVTTVRTAGGRQYQLEQVRTSLTESGLSSEEARQALQRLSDTRCIASSSGQEVRVSRSVPNSNIMDSMELYELIDSRRKRVSVDVSSMAASPAWVQQCELMMEQANEQDYAGKRMLAARVRAYLHHNRGTNALEQQLDESSSSSGSESDDDIPSMSRIVSTKSERPASNGNAPIELNISASRLFDKMISSSSNKVSLPNKFVRTLMADFKNQWVAKYRGASLLTSIDVPKDVTQIVVGDVHGQLQDVLTIFLQHGLPSATTRYLFNGDIADRGDQAVEIFFLLFAFFLEEPDSIIINRGNHEDEEMNILPADKGGGFRDECLKKYTPGVLTKFIEIFKVLPLATVLSSEVMVVHGGLPRNAKTNLTLPFIASIEASKVCCPSPESSAGCMKDQAFMEMLWSDPVESLGFQASPRGAGILWGPDMSSAFLKRAGLKFIIRSHEVPKDGRGWMEHHLGLVYTVFSASNYGGNIGNPGAVVVLTRKTGALATGEAKLDVQFAEFYAADISNGQLKEISLMTTHEERRKALKAAGVARAAADRQASAALRQSQIIDRMAARVVEKRIDLWDTFMSNDASGSGRVTYNEWLQNVQALCGDHFPWALAFDVWKLNDGQACNTPRAGDEEPSVAYGPFLERFQVCLSKDTYMNWRPLLIKELSAAIAGLNKGVEETIQLFDKNGDGTVTENDFMTVLRMQTAIDGKGDEVPLLTHGQIHALARGLFHSQEQDNKEEKALNVHSFFARFTAMSQQANTLAGSDPLKEWRPVVSKLGLMLQLRQAHGANLQAHVPKRSSTASRRFTEIGKVLHDEFKKSDTSADGFLNYEEFVQMIQKIPEASKLTHNGQIMDETMMKKLWNTVSSLDGNPDTINFFEFLEAFMVKPEMEDQDLTHRMNIMVEGMNEHMLSTLYRHRHALCSGCIHKDLNGTGKLTAKSFEEVLNGVDEAISTDRRVFSVAEITGLANALVDEDGFLSYRDLLRSLEVNDAFANNGY